MSKVFKSVDVILILQADTINGSRYRLETFFVEEDGNNLASRRASNLWPLHVNVEIKSRSPWETDDYTGRLEMDEIKHKI